MTRPEKYFFVSKLYLHIFKVSGKKPKTFFYCIFLGVFQLLLKWGLCVDNTFNCIKYYIVAVNFLAVYFVGPGPETKTPNPAEVHHLWDLDSAAVPRT